MERKASGMSRLPCGAHGPGQETPCLPHGFSHCSQAFSEAHQTGTAQTHKPLNELLSCLCIPGEGSLRPVPYIWVSTQANLAYRQESIQIFKGTCSGDGIPPGDNQIFIYSWPSVGRGGPSTPAQPGPAASSRLPTGAVRSKAAWP